MCKEYFQHIFTLLPTFLISCPLPLEPISRQDLYCLPVLCFYFKKWHFHLFTNMHFHVYMYYNLNWFIPSIFFLPAFIPFLWWFQQV
jgi:hypothetical protein